MDLNSAHRRGCPKAGSISLLGACLDRGKSALVGGHDLVLELLSQPFDVVLVDRIAGTSHALSPVRAVDSYVSFVDTHNTMAWVTVSAFGLSGPRRDDTATELGVAAASGMLASVRDEASGQPLKLGGQQSLLNTGQAAALATCHAIDLARNGTSVHLDLSAVEATLAMGPVLQVGGDAPGHSHCWRSQSVRRSCQLLWNASMGLFGSPLWKTISGEAWSPLWITQWAARCES